MVRGDGIALKGQLRAPLPDMPTDALPGTAEKVNVMQARARLAQQLFHPDDADPDVVVHAA
jgi:hypothetical protein